MRKQLSLLREFSIPLVVGVFAAIAWANLAPEQYHHFLHAPLLAGLSLHFVTNDLFMTFFFGIAAVEITQSCLPGGDLHPLRRAVNPLLATAGGVLGPVGLYLLLNAIFGDPSLTRGWGIPTATDIALAWLAARFIFGKGHPAISFLLLLAIADDAVGLVIIALFYGDPHIPAEPAWLVLTAAAMALCYLMRSRRVMSYWPYLLLGGTLSWFGLFRAHLHPALALVFVIPFLPNPSTEKGHLFEMDPGDLASLSRFEQEDDRNRVLRPFGPPAGIPAGDRDGNEGTGYDRHRGRHRFYRRPVRGRRGVFRSGAYRGSQDGGDAEPLCGPAGNSRLQVRQVEKEATPQFPQGADHVHRHSRWRVRHQVLAPFQEEHPEAADVGLRRQVDAATDR